MIEIVTLDGRHKGFGKWKYFVVVYGLGSVQRFCNIRAWCWEQYGASKSLSEYTFSDRFNDDIIDNQHWCWSSSEERRIYLKTDAEATLLALKWS